MIQLSLKAAKAGFFDRDAVTKAVDRTTRRVLSKFGAFVRTRSRTSIRKRKGISPPGKPPHSHTGLLRDLIFFSYDQDRQSVVIGPVRLGRGTGEAPAALEYGGRSTIRRRGKSVRVTIGPRPYMQPAFDAELPGLPALWKDSIR